MHYRKLDASPDSYVLIFEAGDDLVDLFSRFAADHALSASSFRAVGALSRVRLGWYDPVAKAYATAVDLSEQVELVALSGDIGRMNGQPVLHMHAAIARRDGATLGGHVLEARVNPTCELFLTEYPDVLEKVRDERFNLNFFKV